MPSLGPTIALHRLAIETDKRMVKQAPRCMQPNLATNAKVKAEKLVNADYITDLQYFI